ncbi:hypothetical protein [Ferroacidibacillus organovorans]|uniref:Uncharacterized protein n=1 Tax=Ferroacidibacillus organovorans TaxID=1765683 RepID=A0A1V4ET21_9BACL|nr:hypothetical protein [Ferroacidibacillus organovorans]OPG15798.1 hypothetical protein B2M26_09280 [Ferroacidibacillus organovorans]
MKSKTGDDWERKKAGEIVTKRFTIDDVAGMFQVRKEDVRVALVRLQEMRSLSAETFFYAGEAARIAPSDLDRIRRELGALKEAPIKDETASQRGTRRIIRKTVRLAAEEDSTPDA